MAKFKLDGKSLYAALSVVTKVVGANPEMLTIKAFKEKIEIRAFNNMMTLLTVVDSENEDVSEFSAPLDRLKAICNKRGPMVFTVEDQMMRYKELGSSYKGDIVISGSTPIDVQFKSDAPKLPIVDISEFLPFVDLVPVIEKELMLFINVVDNNLCLATGDNYHVAFLSMNKETPNIDLALPMTYQKMFNSVFGAKPYTLHKTENFFFARNSTVLLQLPAVDAPEVSFDIIRQYVQKQHNLTSDFRVQSQAMKDMIDSLGSVNDDTKSLKLTIKKSFMSMSMQSSIGKASDGLEVSMLGPCNGAPVNLNYKMISEAFNKASKAQSVDVAVIEDRALRLTISVKDAKITYIMNAVSE